MCMIEVDVVHICVVTHIHTIVPPPLREVRKPSPPVEGEVRKPSPIEGDHRKPFPPHTRTNTYY